MAKENRGGKRKGSGRKPKFDEETITIAFRVPISKVDEITLIVNKRLKKYLTNTNK